MKRIPAEFLAVLHTDALLRRHCMIALDQNLSFISYSESLYNLDKCAIAKTDLVNFLLTSSTFPQSYSFFPFSSPCLQRH